jgi:electron transfer flavoprotein beta subunit
MDMHVMVVLRLVPDTDEEFELSEDGKGIDREWIGLKLNEFDDHALEEAVLLKEAYGAMVTAVAMDADGTDRLLQTALARGADRVLKIEHGLEGMIPARVMAQLVAEVVREQACDLVLTGVQTVEDLFGQLAPTLGAVLGWPQVSAVCKLQIAGSEVLAGQEHSGGVVNTLAISLPTVVGVQSASQPLRYVSGSKLREVLSVKIPAVEVQAQEDLSGVEIQSIQFPEVAGRAEMLDGGAESVAERLVAIFRERGFNRK